jgi:hypothetical protein
VEAAEVVVAAVVAGQPTITTGWGVFFLLSQPPSSYENTMRLRTRYFSITYSMASTIKTAKVC